MGGGVFFSTFHVDTVKVYKDIVIDMRDPKTDSLRFYSLAFSHNSYSYHHKVFFSYLRRYTLVACTNVYRPRVPRALRRLGLVERPREVGKQIPPVLAAGGEPQQVLGHACSNTLKGGRIGSVGGG